MISVVPTQIEFVVVKLLHAQLCVTRYQFNGRPESLTNSLANLEAAQSELTNAINILKEL
jgi:hypothetical protein